MNLKVFRFIITSIFISGCATFQLTPQSLQSQLEACNKNGKRIELTYVKCFYKDSIERTLFVTPQKSIRITKFDDTRQQFYLITAYLQDSMIMGSKSVIFEIPIKPIKISEIKKIEVDGR